MANTTPAPTTQITQAPKHHVRTFFAALCGFIAVNLLLLAVAAAWIDRTLTNTPAFTTAVGSLAEKPAVQAFVVAQASDGLLGDPDMDYTEPAAQLYGQQAVQGKSNEQLKEQVTTTVQDSLQQLVSSPGFIELWKQTIQDSHAQLVSQLDSGAEEVSLNLKPLIDGIVNGLAITDLQPIANQLELDDGSGVVTLTSDQLGPMHTVYRQITPVVWGLIVAAVVLMVACVALSVHHMKTFRRIALSVGIVTGIFAILLTIPTFVSGELGETPQFAAAVVGSLTYELRNAFAIIAVVSIVLAIGSKIHQLVLAKHMAHKSTK